MSEDLTAAVTPPPLPEGWTINKVAALVHELAINMYDVKTILDKYGLSEQQFESLQGNEFYKKCYESAVFEWNKPQSINKRIALESAVGIEAVLPTIVARCASTGETLPNVVAALKVLAELSGSIGNQNRAQEAPREQFKITINLGADTQSFQKSSAPPGLLEIQPFPQGESQGQEILGVLATTGDQPKT